MATPTRTLGAVHHPGVHPSFSDKLNTVWHERANRAFMVVVLAHWAEHLLQAWQVYVLDWPRPMARGLLGLFFPWLVSSEVLHYGYALIMLVGLWVLRKGYVGRAERWWMIAFWIQFWHHIEHLLLFGQAMLHRNLFGSPVPTSIIQMWIPRIELHLFYNSIVFVPMVVAMYYHLVPNPEERRVQRCSCALKLTRAPSHQAA